MEDMQCNKAAAMAEEEEEAEVRKITAAARAEMESKENDDDGNNDEDSSSSISIAVSCSGSEDEERKKRKSSEEDEENERKKSGERDAESEKQNQQIVPDGDGVVDISGKNWSFPVLARGLKAAASGNARGLYLYNNVFTVIPSAVCGLQKLKTLKVFSNEVKLFPAELGQLSSLEQLHMKVSYSEIGGLPPLQKLHSLKVLELHRTPPRLSGFTLSSDISCLSSLTRLSVCHFSISFLPMEIGCLKKLEELDLSFNKLRNLPEHISKLMGLKSLKVACNKLVSLPAGLSSLSNLNILDVSNNRLTTLQPLKLFSMSALHELNAQYNKIRGTYKFPPWISYKLEGNELDLASSSSEEEVSSHSHTLSGGNSCVAYSSMETMPTSANSVLSKQKQRKLWKRQCRDCQQKTDNQQQKARQERLNNSRKMRSDNSQVLNQGEIAMESVSETVIGSSGLSPFKASKDVSKGSEAQTKFASDVKNFNTHAQNMSNINQSADTVLDNQQELGSASVVEDVKEALDDSSSSNYQCEGNSVANNEKGVDKNDKIGLDKRTCSKIVNKDQSVGNSEKNKLDHKVGKRHAVSSSNSKPSKRTRSMDDFSRASNIYSEDSLCGTDVYLPDGFYDAGRDRPFKSLIQFEKESPCLDLDSREVILLDRERDEELDAIILSAQKLLSGLKRLKLNNIQDAVEIDDFQRGMLLAFFVSDYFGGSDKSGHVSAMRRAVVGANKGIPFVCSCPSFNVFSEHIIQHSSVPNIGELCKQSLRLIKEQLKSNVVPLGSLRYGVCRHRAILLKYLCDRADPPIPCELVRGYMDFTPHAWNIIVVDKDGQLVRMLFDACRPFDIREEKDPEYFHRYIPLSRFHISISRKELSDVGYCGIVPCRREKVGHGASGSIVYRCTVGNLPVAMKVWRVEAGNVTKEQQKVFELSCLGEIRMLTVLRGHPCIVNLYGHQIVSFWKSSDDEVFESRGLQCSIVMEYVKGGSLEVFLNKLAAEGKKFTPMKLALSVAMDIAHALRELHSKAIIHRDIKSGNVLIDLDNNDSKGRPLAKLCDFDRAIPLHSTAHRCCLAHYGVPSTDMCVGTSRWMSPEMVQAMHTPESYGLETDLWSYGCLILELLTLEAPYAGLSDSEVYQALQMKRRPELSSEIEDMLAESNEELKNVYDVPEDDIRTLKLLVDLFYSCTDPNPWCRSTANQAYEMLCRLSDSSKEIDLN